MRNPFIVLVNFSPVAGDVLRKIADKLSLEIRQFTPGEVGVIPPAAAVVLAACGAEREAIEWLQARRSAPGIPVFLIGADPGRRTAAQAVLHGAADYFALPDDTELLQNALAGMLIESADGAPAPDRDALAGFEGFAGDSEAIRALRERVARLLPFRDGTIHILGEAGTGKEMLARALHQGGPRHAAPFVPVDCSVHPRDVLESELFGSEEGTPRPGLFELADGGTLFLDEIGALPPEIQFRLLQVLETGETLRVGATRPRKLDIRVIAASREPLGSLARNDTFRRDLRLRVETVTLELPPLRRRGADVLQVAARLLASLAALHRLPLPEIGDDVRRALQNHSWPGNIRELRHSLERALLLSPPGTLSVSELFHAGRRPAMAPAPLPFPAQLNEIATAAARATLEACGGNVSRAARQLHVSRGRLRRLIRPNRPGRPAQPLVGALSNDARTDSSVFDASGQAGQGNV